MAELKEQPGGDIGIHGSIALAGSLLRARLVDELRLVVAPSLAGKGRRLFADDDALDSLELRRRGAQPEGHAVPALPAGRLIGDRRRRHRNDLGDARKAVNVGCGVHVLQYQTTVWFCQGRRRLHNDLWRARHGVVAAPRSTVPLVDREERAHATAARPAVKSYSQLFIGGRWVAPSSDSVIEVISPVTEEVIATVPEAQPADVDAAVAAARRAFDEGPWPRMTPAERAAVLCAFATRSAAPGRHGRRVHCRDRGPAGLSRAFHEGAFVVGRRRYAARASRSRRRGHGPTAAGVIVREPVGVVAAIIPWNGPVATASLKIAPALAAGCTVVLKPAPEGPVSVMLLAEAVEAAGLPEGVVSVLPAGREVGEHLVAHPGVDKVAFTGSTAAGRRIMSLCGERIARVTLELGGKSAAIICDDIALDDVLPDWSRRDRPPARSAPRSRASWSRASATTRSSTRSPACSHDQGRRPARPRHRARAARRRAPARPRRALHCVGKEEGATLVTGGGRPGARRGLVRRADAVRRRRQLDADRPARRSSGRS